MTENLTLRVAEAADAAAIRDLTRQAYAKWVSVIGREPGPMEADYDEAVRKHRFDLLYRDGAFIALIETVRYADHLLIKNVAVMPSCQGRGYGRKLLAHAEELAAALGYSEIRLYTNERFDTDVRLYLRLGYKIDRTEEFRGGIVLHMRKPVQPASN